MEQKQLRREVSNGELSKNLYLFYGEEDFLKKYYCDKIKNMTVSDFEDFNFYVFDGKIISVEQLNSAIESPPIMSEKKIILFKKTGIFKTVDEKIKSFLSKTFENIPEYAVIVFLEDEIDKRSGLFKLINKKGGVVEFPFPDDTTLTNWIIRQAMEKNIIIEKTDAFYLIEHANKGMNSIQSELEKLFSYCKAMGKITKSDIDLLVTKSLESRVFYMIDSIIEKNPSKAIAACEQMITLKEPYVKIEFLVVQAFERLLKIKIYQKKPILQGELAKIVGVSPYFLPKYTKGAAAFSQEELMEILSSFAQTDYDLRSGKGDEWGSFMDFILKYSKK